MTHKGYEPNAEVLVLRRALRATRYWRPTATSDCSRSRCLVTPGQKLRLVVIHWLQASPQI